MAVHIDEKLCKGCGLCVRFCERGVLRMSERRNVKGYNVAEVCQADRCKPCKLCEINCPDFAVFVEVKKARSRS
jgi:2-oxoglutarate ferredoxin oxidoreductase subunit delta